MKNWKEITIVSLSIVLLIAVLLPISGKYFTKNGSSGLSMMANSYGYGDQCRKYYDMSMEIINMLIIYQKGINVDSLEGENIYSGRANEGDAQLELEFGSTDPTLGREKADQALVNMVNEVESLIGQWIECRQSELN